jgi:hypothetical protein
LTVYSSTISVVECVKLVDESVNGGPTREDDEVKSLFKGILTSGKSGVMPVMPSPKITDAARDLRWTHHITCRGMDRIHIATALAMTCSHFLTTDQKLGQENIQKIAKLGLVVCTADAVADLLPDQYKQLHIKGTEHRAAPQIQPAG